MQCVHRGVPCVVVVLLPGGVTSTAGVKSVAAQWGVNLVVRVSLGCNVIQIVPAWIPWWCAATCCGVTWGVVVLQCISADEIPCGGGFYAPCGTRVFTFCMNPVVLGRNTFHRVPWWGVLPWWDAVEVLAVVF